MSVPRHIALISSSSGQGKTTLGRELAARIEVPFVELDAWVHGPNWAETPDAELIARLEPVLALDGWVIDGTYQRKLGTRVLDAADLIVWLDLPFHVWFLRLLRRSLRRIVGSEEIWNGNRETWTGAFWGRQSLFGYALVAWYRRGREWPKQLSGRPVLRLRSAAEVAGFLECFAVL